MQQSRSSRKGAKIERDTVSSRGILSIGYDRESLLLEVEFQNGSVYQYVDFPEDLYLEMSGAESLGRFFTTRIRGRFKCRLAES